MSIIIIITIIRIIVKVETRANSKDLEPVSVTAEAMNSSNTRAYHTESGETTKAPLSIPCGLIMTRLMTAIEQFDRKRIAVNSLYTLILGVSNHQTIEQSKIPLALG